jgi:PAS domain S-box-containing protein
MAVRAATDGYNSIPPGGDEGFGTGVDAATAVIDGRGSVLAWSAGARRLLGYAAGDVTGRPAATLLVSDLPASARRCLTEQRDWNGRVSLRHMNGGRVDLELLAHPSRGSDGSLRWILVTFTECQPFAGTDRVRPDAPFMDWAFTQSPFALAIHDRDMLCLRVNDRMCQMFGLHDAAFVMGLVVSELVTNAIRHAESPIQLRLIRDRTLICEVSDGSSTAPHLRRARAFDEGGRGLLLVSHLTQRWGTRQTPHGKTIWAEQALPRRDVGDLLHQTGSR